MTGVGQGVCPATREAIWEQDEFDCPICGRPAEEHPSEDDDD